MRLESISHSFETKRRLFEDLTFEFSGGTSYAFCGDNGSGKSTLLKICAGLLTPTTGSVRVDSHGRDLNQRDRLACSGFVAPYLNIYEEFTLREHMRLQFQLRGESECERSINETLEYCELSARRDSLIRTLSSGLKQRAKLALALLHQPVILFLDEPGTTMDKSGHGIISRIVRDSISEKRLILIATNDPAERDLCMQSIELR